ncbi:MAG: hypothetical protein WCS56_00045 [Bacilli bacterium]
MNKKDIENKLNIIFEENGLYCYDSTDENNLLLQIDSMVFISLIVDIESTFNIGIPDELLLLSNFQNKEQIIETIFKLLTNKNTDIPK